MILETFLKIGPGEKERGGRERGRESERQVRDKKTEKQMDR